LELIKHRLKKFISVGHVGKHGKIKRDRETYLLHVAISNRLSWKCQGSSNLWKPIYLAVLVGVVALKKVYFGWLCWQNIATPTYTHNITTVTPTHRSTKKEKKAKTPR